MVAKRDNDSMYTANLCTNAYAVAGGDDNDDDYGGGGGEG